MLMSVFYIFVDSPQKILYHRKHDESSKLTTRASVYLYLTMDSEKMY